MATEKLNIKITGDGAGARTELNKTAKSVGGFGSALKGAAALGIGFGSGMEVARLAIRSLQSAIAAVPRFVFDAIESTSLYGDEIAKMSRNISIGAEALQVLSFAAERAGTDKDSLTRGIKRLSVAMDDARRGSEMYVEVFDRLGVEVVDSAGQLRATEDVFLDLADAIQAQGLSAQTTADLQRLLGRSGSELGNLMAGGSDGVAAMAARLDELGGIMSSEALIASEVYRDALTDLGIATKSLERVLGEGLMPTAIGLTFVLTDLAMGLRTVTERAGEFLESHEELTAGLAAAAEAVFPRTAAAVLLLGAAHVKGKVAIEGAISDQIDAQKASRMAALAEIATMGDRVAALQAEARARSEAAAAALEHARTVEFLLGLDRLAAKGGAAEQMRAIGDATDGLKSQLAAAAGTADMLADNIARLELSIPVIDAQTLAWERAKIAAMDYEQQAAVMVPTLQAVGNIAGIVGDIIVDQYERGSKAARTASLIVFGAQQAAALAIAIIQMQVAIAQANASAPYPYNIPAISGATATGVGTIATIAATTVGGIIAGVADAGLTSDQVNSAIRGSHSTFVVQRGESIISRSGSSEIDQMLALQRRQMEAGGRPTQVRVNSPVMLDGRQVGRFVDDHLIDTTERGRGYGRRVQRGTV